MSCRTVGRHLVSVQTSHPATVGFEVTKVSQGGQAYGSAIMEVSGGCPGIRDCVTITFLSFRASEARHGIQYFQYALDTGLRRYDDFYCAFRHYDTVSFAGVPCFVASTLQICLLSFLCPCALFIPLRRLFPVSPQFLCAHIFLLFSEQILLSYL